MYQQKAKINFKKHGISFEEAKEALTSIRLDSDIIAMAKQKAQDEGVS